MVKVTSNSFKSYSPVILYRFSLSYLSFSPKIVLNLNVKDHLGLTLTLVAQREKLTGIA